MDETKLYFSQNINYLIEKNRLTYHEIENAIGVPSGTLAGWRTGRLPRDLLKLKKLCVLFNVSIDDLLFRKLNPRN